MADGRGDPQLHGGCRWHGKGNSEGLWTRKSAPAVRAGIPNSGGDLGDRCSRSSTGHLPTHWSCTDWLALAECDKNNHWLFNYRHQAHSALQLQWGSGASSAAARRYPAAATGAWLLAHGRRLRVGADAAKQQMVARGGTLVLLPPAPAASAAAAASGQRPGGAAAAAQLAPARGCHAG